MLEVWGMDSLQEMLDTSSLQHPSQVVRINAGAACPMAPRKLPRNQPRALELARNHCIKTTILRLKFNVKFDHDELYGVDSVREVRVVNNLPHETLSSAFV